MPDLKKLLKVAALSQESRAEASPRQSGELQGGGGQAEWVFESTQQLSIRLSQTRTEQSQF